MESFVESYEAMFAKSIIDVAMQSKYYLVFGKVTDRLGVYTSFKIATNLPAFIRVLQC